MEKEKLMFFIELGYSHREIAVKLNCSQTNVKYWLNKYELKTKHCEKNKKLAKDKTLNCKLCGNLIANNERNRSHCQSCTTRIRRYRTKQRGVELLGGKCNRCGWSGNLAAFEFHHINDDKDYGIGSANNKSWEVVKNEILKCELLCLNCHRIEHTKYDKDEKFMNVVKGYK
jgi:predicted transcriptional regulator